MNIYILEYGYDSRFTNTEKAMEDAYSNFDKANKKALSYPEHSRPDIYLYDLDNHKVIKRIEVKEDFIVDDNIHYNDIDVPF